MNRGFGRRGLLSLSGAALFSCAGSGGSRPWPTLSDGDDPFGSRKPGPRAFVPISPGANAYVSDDDVVPAARLSGLERALFDLVVAQAQALGRRAPTVAFRYQQAARELARLMPGNPVQEVTRFVFSHCGIVESEVTSFSLRAFPEPDAEMLSRQGAGVRQVIETGSWNRIGVGVDRRPDSVCMLAAFWNQSLVLGPVPRRISGAVSLRGRMLIRVSDLELVVTTPKGGHRRVRPHVSGSAFDVLLSLDSGDGVYQVELVGSAEQGPVVLANFPVFVGLDPPEEIFVRPPEVESFSTVEEAERALVDAINRERSRAGLRTLRIDERLTEVARRHSEDMAENRFVAHRSARTGDVADRVRRAGLDPKILAENVGLAGSVREVHRGLMGSPGHRVNILLPQVTHVGVGIVPRRQSFSSESSDRSSEAGTLAIYVTELFAGGL